MLPSQYSSVDVVTDMNGKHYAKKAYKDIKLKSGLTIPKGASLMVTPIIGSDRSCKAVYNGVEYKLSYGSVFKPPAEKTLEKLLVSVIVSGKIS